MKLYRLLIYVVGVMSHALLLSTVVVKAIFHVVAVKHSKLFHSLRSFFIATISEPSSPFMTKFLPIDNLVLINGLGSTMWDSRNSNLGVSFATLHDNGNLVLSNVIGFVWSLGQAALDISAFILVKANEEVEERAKRVASAARRWKEYLRWVVDKPPTFKLPEASLSKDK
ncbi:hypothetical protein JHK86_050628 [Glycine max]|nr:hypothetical protein JHK86_050628 [Glycine max]